MTAIAARASTKHVVETETTWIPLRELQFDHRVNREVKDWQVARIAAEFDPDAVGVIEVSVRRNGDFIVLSGQHRVLALRGPLGYDDQKIECRLHHGLTVAREARLAIEYNNTRQSSHADIFLHRVIAEDHEAVEINNVVIGVGLCVSTNGGDGHVTATRALERVYQGVGFRANDRNPGVLHDTLRVILQAWGKTSSGLQANLIEGVGSVLLRHGDDIDRVRLANKLSTLPGGPTKVIATAQQWREAHNGKVSRCVAGVIVEAYNKGLPKARQLPAWFSSE